MINRQMENFHPVFVQHEGPTDTGGPVPVSRTAYKDKKSPIVVVRNSVKRLRSPHLSGRILRSEKLYLKEVSPWGPKVHPTSWKGKPSGTASLGTVGGRTASKSLSLEMVNESDVWGTR